MYLGLIMKLLHVLTAFWLVGGVLARDITFWKAGRASDVRVTHTLLEISDFFERVAVIPGGTILVILGLLTAWLGRWPLFGFLQGAPSNWLLVSLVLYLGIMSALGPLRLVPRRKQRAQAAEAALREGEITGELRAALNDKVVNRFRETEVVIIAVIIVLMVAKPF